MTNAGLLDNTPVAESVFMGRMITSRPGFMIGPENYTAMYNMRYMPGGLGVETRGGCRRFNTTAIGAYDIVKIWQHLYTRWQTQYQDTYCVSSEKKLYKADSIPESSAGAGSLGSSQWDLASGAAIPSFCQVEDIVAFTNKKEVVAYQGTTPPIDGFLVGYDIDNSTAATAEDNKVFYMFTDEVTDNATTTYATISLDTLATNNVNALYVGFFQPISAINITMGATVNDIIATLTVQKWTGSAWSSLTVTDGTVSTVSGSAPQSDNFNDASINASIWTQQDLGGNGSFTETTVMTINTGDGNISGSTFTPTWLYQTINGNFDVQVKITQWAGGSADNQCGIAVLLNDGGVDDGVHICVHRVSGGSGWRVQRLDRVAGVNNEAYTDTSLATYYLKVVRAGSTFTTYYSSDGSSWTARAAGGGTAFTSSAEVKLGIFANRNGGADVNIVLDDFTVNSSDLTKPLAQSGAISWTYDGTEAPRRIHGLTLFWYRVTTDTVLTPSITITGISATKPWAALKDVTDGERMYATGFVQYDATDTKYVDFTSDVITGQRGVYAKLIDAAADTDVASGDAFYLGFPIRILGIVLDFCAGYNNDGSASSLTVSYWNGSAWTAYAADEMLDGTLANSKTFNQNGEIRLEDKGTDVKMTVVGGKKLPMYWYKLTFSAKLYNDTNDEMRIWNCQGIPAPITLKKYNCCLNFKDRLFLFGRDDLPNVADYSSYKLPYCLSGYDTSSVQPRITFGKVDDIVAAINFYNEAIIFKRTEVWMLEGDSPQTFGTLLLDDTIGCVAPETVKLVKTWTTLPDGRKDFKHAVFFMAQDGVYGVDGLKLWKVSGDIDNYFDPFNSEAIKVGYHDDSFAWYDSLKNNYHLVIYSGSTPTQYEFVYDTEQLRWCGPFVRAVPVKSGGSILGSNNERYEYGGGNDGRLYHLEYGSSDVDSSGNAYAIDNYIQTADLWKGLQYKYSFNEVHLYGVAQSSGSITVTLYGNQKSTGVTLGTISMVNSGYGYFAGMRKFIDVDSSGAAMENKFQSVRLRFGTNTSGVRQQLLGHLVKKSLFGEAAKAS